MLIEGRPDLPTAYARRSKIERYEKWVKPDQMARYYILASMCSVLHQKKDYLSARDMILSLKGLFGEQE